MRGHAARPGARVGVAWWQIGLMRQKKLARLLVERSEEDERSLRRRSEEEDCLRRQARDDERPWVRCDAAWPVAGYARRRESGEWLRGEKRIPPFGWFIVVGVMLVVVVVVLRHG